MNLRLRSQGIAPMSRTVLRLFAGAALLLVIALTVVQPASAAPRAAHPAQPKSTGRTGGPGVPVRPAPVSLSAQWNINAHSSVSGQPTLVGNVVYWGSWDGNAHATRTDGVELWDKYIGRTVDNNCSPSAVGPAAAPVIASVTIGGVNTPVAFYGGGDAQVYALNASTGAIIWIRRLGVSPANFLWASPAFINGSLYIGVSSFGDCPLTQGLVVKLNPATGAIQATFKSVPNGCVGGGVWTNLTYDPLDRSIYFSTGTPSACGGYSASLVKVRASDLSVLSAWKLPTSEETVDSDFGAAPTLFAMNQGGVAHQMVGLVNKNGYFYAFERSNIAAGYLWKRQVAVAGACPQCDEGSIATAGWDGYLLYVGGGETYAANGTHCKGSVRALNPSNGATIWERCFQEGPVLGAIVYQNRLLGIEEGDFVLLLNWGNGTTRYQAANPNGGQFWSTPTLSSSAVYAGSMDGYLYSFRIP
jgi:outer membrane protein assembly factor BamB